MARLRTRYLSCFYCGRKQTTPYDGKTRQFECPSCEATNYLDENGEITDPPVATDKEATPAKFAVARALSPPSSPTSAIFCDKCIRNQHLLRASLAQYLPDPDDPEYEKLEKDYYRFRNNQEKQHPQICAECEPKVRQRLEQAAYTAKTDVLRRMIERSSTARKQVKGRSWLDFFDAAGRWLWVAGFLAQLGWHVSLLGMLYQVSGGSLPLLEILPEAERIMGWSIWATVLSVWWNPHFPQVVRGFTKHIDGVPTWYVYQVITIAIRLLLPSSESLSLPDPRLFNMQLAGHAFTLAFTLLILLLSRRSIRIDMAPLFRPIKQPLLSHQQRPNTPKPDEKKSLSELLDEISNSPPDPLRPPSPVIPDGDTLFLPRPPQQNLARTAAENTHRDSVDLNGLNLNTPAVQYPEEMEWSPTVSRHRAFNAFAGPPQPQQQQHTNPFWAKVPPAPVPPAHLAFKPVSGQSQVKERMVSGPKKFGFGQQREQRRREQQQAQETASESRDWEFRQPKFFPPGGETDPRNSLSDMFGQSFSLSQEEREREEREKRGWFGFLSGTKKE